MSYHQIEDTVEDYIRLINKTALSKLEKRDLIYNLYRFHDRFDTSYTRFRVLNILQENCYLYSLPIRNHPDYSKHQKYFSQFDEHSQEWIPAYIENEEKGSIYLKKQKIWFEVNDEFWIRIQSRLPKEEQSLPQEMTIISLFVSLLNISLQSEDYLLAKRLYAIFVNSILQFDLDENDGIPKNFNLWLKNSELLKIRKIIEENQHILSLKDKDYKNDEYLALPKLRNELEFATKPDEKAKVQILLDAKTSIETIEKKYRAAIDNPADINKYHLIYEFFREKLDNHWEDGVKEIGEERGIITFFKKRKCEKRNGVEFYNCLIIDYISDIKTISFNIGIQNTNILSWQKREASSKPELQHFTQNLFSYLNDKEIDMDKNISNWGGWEFDIKHTKKTLNKRLNSLWSFYEKYHSSVNDFYHLPLLNWIGKENSDEIMNDRKKLLNKGISFFGNEMDFKLFVACLNLKNSNYEIAKKLSKEIKGLLEQGLGSEQLKRRITQGLSYLDKGKGVYPEISTMYSNRLYEK